MLGQIWACEPCLSFPVSRWVVRHRSLEAGLTHFPGASPRAQTPSRIARGQTDSCCFLSLGTTPMLQSQSPSREDEVSPTAGAEAAGGTIQLYMLSCGARPRLSWVICSEKDHLRTKNWPESTGRMVLRMSNNACFLQNPSGVERDSTHTSWLFYPRSKDKTDESETQPDFGPGSRNYSPKNHQDETDEQTHTSSFTRSFSSAQNLRLFLLLCLKSELHLISHTYLSIFFIAAAGALWVTLPVPKPTVAERWMWPKRPNRCDSI